jgi:acetyl-CoA acetyltransferase
MSDAFIVGSYSSAFGRFPDASFRELTAEAVLGAVSDAGLDSGVALESIWFGNVLMDYWGQHSTRGHFCLIPLVESGFLTQRTPIINVEGGCSTGSMALHGAVKDVLCGDAEISLALGVEKTFRPDVTREETFSMFRAGENAFNPEETLREYELLAERSGKPLQFGADRTMFMDTYAAQAAYHMARYGTSQRQIAAAAAKNHSNGALNPLAQYRFAMHVDEVLADREVSYPLTRSMCAPIGDGAAASIVCSEAALSRFSSETRDRAIRVAAASLTGGCYRKPEEPSLSRVAADRAYARAGVRPEDVDVAEVHDATAFGELYQSEMLRLCADGEGGPFVESGATALDGRVPLNTSGGLLSKGHPIAASGLSMIEEIVRQLRGEAGVRQIADARIGLIENGGGIMGLEEAACGVTILERPVKAV